METFVERAWKQCRDAAEPVFGSIPEVPGSSRVDEIASLCTRIASKAERWKTQCQDSAQEATLLLAKSFADFRSVDDRLREVEPAITAHKAMLDNWPMYCNQNYE